MTSANTASWYSERLLTTKRDVWKATGNMGHPVHTRGAIAFGGTSRGPSSGKWPCEFGVLNFQGVGMSLYLRKSSMVVPSKKIVPLK